MSWDSYEDFHSTLLANLSFLSNAIQSFSALKLLQVSSGAEGRYACMQEAMERGLGEGNLDKIEVLGESIESTKERFRDL